MNRFKLTIALAALLALGLLACESADKFADDDDDDDGSSDGDTDTDADADGDGDTDEDCTPGELFCQDGDVHECTGPDNQSVLVEECPSPLICINGMCVTPDACGEAMANKSNIGCEYWAVDMDNTTPEQPYAIVVSNLDAATVHVKVERKSGGTWQILDEADLPSKQTHVFMLGNTTVQGTYHLANQAFRVTSDLPVVAYQFNPYAGLTADNSDVCTNDGTLLLATSGLDKFYFVLGSVNNTGSGSANIVATKDNTEVMIRPSTSISAGGSLSAMSAGQEYTFMMQEADVIQLGAAAGDISGTYIQTDKPVAVFGGNTCAQVPTGTAYCDHIEHQLFPITTWGQEFVAARTVIRSTYQAPENDYWRVIAGEDGTLITTYPAIAGLNGVTMNKGQVIEVGVNHSFTISAGAPIMVGQYLAGHEATDVDFYAAGGDPAMALLPPTEQFLTNYVFLAPEKYLLDYVVITHRAGAYPNLDGAPVSSNSNCISEGFDADWEITRCLIPDFTHTVDAADPVGITVWGYGGRVSYGYTGGLNLQTINPIVPE
jgi:hypothetical protein